MIEQANGNPGKGGGEEVDPEEVEMGGEEVQESPIVICPRIPYSPSRAELSHHQLTHWPFRSWCKECVMGKSRSSPHSYKRRKTREGPTIPSVSFAYMFLDGKSPVLVYRDRLSRKIFSHAVTSKGASDPWIVAKVVEDLDSLGYGRILMKTDQEPAIKDLQAQVRQAR